MEEREAYIGFAAFPGVGPLRFKLLTDFFGSAASAWFATEKILREIGLGDKLTAKFSAFRETFNLNNYVEKLQLQEIKITTRTDDTFPTLLREIPDPPIALYVKGNLPKWDRVIAIVGSRKPTPYGRGVTESITRDLVASSFVIVSGLARGIDGIAHRVALSSGGQTVAVLGCGVDIIYPPDHTLLYYDIIKKSGAIVSEVPPGHTVLKGLFPARNRIIAGLSQGVVITEGAEDSGSLITARFAAEQGREVFAVPGPITSYLSAGPTKLIKQGAKVVAQVSDILEELTLPEMRKPRTANGMVTGDTKEQQLIIDLLTNGELHFDELVNKSGLSASKTGTVLSLLELNGIIRDLGNGKFGLVGS